jgi:hypothetical protein
MKIRQEWLILVFLALFLAIPLATIPGMFEIVGVLLGVLTLALLIMLVLAAIQGRRNT